MSVGDMVIVTMYNGDMHFAKEAEVHGEHVKILGKVGHYRGNLGKKSTDRGTILTTTTNYRLLHLKEIKMMDSIPFEHLDQSLQEVYQKLFASGIHLPGSA